MEHVVFYPGPVGTEAFRRTPSLEEAVRFVEHLRNVEGVTDFAVHTLTPVPLSFRAYYRVEIPAEADEPAAPAEDVVPVLAADDEPAEQQAEQAEQAEEAAVPVQPYGEDESAAAMAQADVLPASEAAAGANGRRGLGFFSH